jgi:hypothetical protein
MYFFWHNYLLILLFVYYWLLVSALLGNHQTNIYKNKNPGAYRTINQFYGFPLTFSFIIIIIIIIIIL